MQRARYPCRQPNSKTIRSVVLCYLSPVFLGKCSVINAKCVCDVQEEGFEMLGTTCEETEMPAIGLFKIYFFNILPFAFCLV